MTAVVKILVQHNTASIGTQLKGTSDGAATLSVRANPKPAASDRRDENGTLKMSIEKTRHPRDYYEDRGHRQDGALEAQYKTLGTAAVRAAAMFKPQSNSSAAKKKLATAAGRSTD
ncbi:MAG: hypothetical protein KDJ16_07660 [Hyphomicrobiales bacterium]|nr:hypothetical protein [Hyphomicrobiales bacterium]